MTKRLTDEDIMNNCLAKAKPAKLDKAKVEQWLKAKLGSIYTKEHLDHLCAYFDSYSLSDILRNRAFFGSNKIELDFSKAGLTEPCKGKKLYTGYTRLTDTVLKELGLDAKDFTETGWYKWNKRVLRTEAYSKIADRRYRSYAFA